MSKQFDNSFDAYTLSDGMNQSAYPALFNDYFNFATTVSGAATDGGALTRPDDSNSTYTKPDSTDPNTKPDSSSHESKPHSSGPTGLEHLSFPKPIIFGPDGRQLTQEEVREHVYGRQQVPSDHKVEGGSNNGSNGGKCGYPKKD